MSRYMNVFDFFIKKLSQESQVILEIDTALEACESEMIPHVAEVWKASRERMGLYRVTLSGVNGAKTVTFYGERGVASTEVRETNINTVLRTCDSVNCSRVVITGEECVHLMVGDAHDGTFNDPGYFQRTVPLYLQRKHVLATVLVDNERGGIHRPRPRPAP